MSEPPDSPDGRREGQRRQGHRERQGSRGPQRRQGRPPKVTERRIVDAVLAEGFIGLTLPSVAGRLGVSTMTLYRHASTRAELLTLVWQHLLDEHPWPDRDLPWRDVLREHATALWDLLAEHPGAVTQMLGATPPARMVTLFEDLVIALMDQGFDADEALLAVDTVVDLTLDHRRGVENTAGPVEGTEGTKVRERIGTAWAPDGDRGRLRREARRAMERAVADDPRVWFHRQLGLVLDGIAARHEPSDTPGQPPRTPERSHD